MATTVDFVHAYTAVNNSGLWSADKYDLSVDFDYHDWSGNEAIFDYFI